MWLVSELVSLFVKPLDWSSEVILRIEPILFNYLEYHEAYGQVIWSCSVYFTCQKHFRSSNYGVTRYEQKPERSSREVVITFVRLEHKLKCADRF